MVSLLLKSAASEKNDISDLHVLAKNNDVPGAQSVLNAEENPNIANLV